jgi:hypothetical protein
MGNTNRRDFLLGAGVTIGSVALGQRVLADSLPGEDESGPQKTAIRGKMRGLMVDAGRVPESLEYYRRLVDFCADWELNQ